MVDLLECSYDTHMAAYFADWAVLISNGDVLGINSTLFGDNLHIPGVGTFLLDIVVINYKPTPQLLVVIHSDFDKPIPTCLQKETPFNPCNAASIDRAARSSGYVSSTL